MTSHHSVIETSHLVFHTTNPAPQSPSPHIPLPYTFLTPVSDLRAFLSYLLSQCNFYLPLELSNECQLPILGEDTLQSLGLICCPVLGNTCQEATSSVALGTWKCLPYRHQEAMSFAQNSLVYTCILQALPQLTDIPDVCVR